MSPASQAIFLMASAALRRKKLLAKIQNGEEPPGKDPQSQFEWLNEKIPEKVSIKYEGPGPSPLDAAHVDDIYDLRGNRL